MIKRAGERRRKGESEREKLVDKRERALSRVRVRGWEGEREPAAIAQLHPRRRSDLSRPRTLEQ